MMKYYACLFLIFLTLLSQSLLAQKKFAIDKGEINFVSNAELEVIKASSKKIKGILDVSTYQFAFSVPIKTFDGFNSDLQKVHFNENYMESHKFPMATFSGKIIEQIDFTVDGSYDVRAKGDLNVHGQKMTRIIKVKLTVKNGVLGISSQFKVPLDDHNITIPKIVNQKIATEIDVTFKGNMKLEI